MNKAFRRAWFIALKFKGKEYTGEEMRAKAHELGAQAFGTQSITLTWQVDGTGELMTGKSTPRHSAMIDQDGRSLPTWWVIANDMHFMVG